MFNGMSENTKMGVIGLARVDRTTTIFILDG